MKKTIIHLPIRALSGFFASLMFVLSSSIAAADLENPVIGNLGKNTSSAATSGAIFVLYFVHIWNVVIQVGAIAVIVYFVWGAFEWLTSGGDSGKLQNARNKMMHAIFGLILLVFSFVFIAFIGRLVFGPAFDILRPTFPTPGSINTQ
jgi:NADH:ubiquinone oxidoreductase subunit 6 (subunit J)